MADTKIDAGTTTAQDSVTAYSVAAEDTDIIEFTTRWSTWYGYYKAISMCSALIDRKAMYVVGKGFSGPEQKIKGIGIDTLNSIFYNSVKTYTIGGDFYAEKIMTKRGKLLNLKPLNPGTIKTVANNRGIIKKYEQFNRNQDVTAKFKPDEIFHLSWNRTADDIHGMGTIEKLEPILLSYNEMLADLKKLFHRYVKPLWIFSVDTDDATEIANFKSRVDTTVTNAENLIIPKDTVDKVESISIPPNSTIDPMPWLKFLQDQFIIAEGIPYVVAGVGGSDAEASTKVQYLGWQQVVEWNQLFLEEQIKSQLNLDLKFNFPASLDPLFARDAAKAPKEETEIKTELGKGKK